MAPGGFLHPFIRFLWIRLGCKMLKTGVLISTMTSTPSKRDGNFCPTHGCGKPTRARGFCVACYYRKLRSGDLQSGSQTAIFRHRLSKIDPIALTAECAVCGPVRISGRSSKSKQFRCVPEANERGRLYKAAYRKSRLLGTGCAICGGTYRLCWDHSHATAEYRGTLCSTCNSGLGMFKG